MVNNSDNPIMAICLAYYDNICIDIFRLHHTRSLSYEAYFSLNMIHHIFKHILINIDSL